MHLAFCLVWLNNNHLTGTIPSEIGDLIFIEKIRLFQNNLVGIIPIELKLARANELHLGNNLLSGTIPDIFDDMMKFSEIDLSNNKLTGPLPESLWGLSSPRRLILESNHLIGTVPNVFCTSISQEAFKVDNLPWLDDSSKVECACCGVKPDCFIWDIGKTTTGGTIRPPCPNSNIHSIEYSGKYKISDVTSKITFNDVINDSGVSSIKVCLSPTGCYEIEEGKESSFNGEVASFVFNNRYALNHNASSMSLNRQLQCDTVSVCSEMIDLNHPKRPLLNHFTQLAVPTMSLLNDPTSLTYQALCWILTEDNLIDEYEICDGTLLQRYVMALFFISQKQAFTLGSFSHRHTCDWPGITCDLNKKIIRQINFFETKLHGSIITELGLLQGLEVIDFSHNNLTGSLPSEVGLLMNLKTLNLSSNRLDGIIDPTTFIKLDNLAILDLSSNKLGGQIPTELFQPSRLKKIALENNLFVGTLSNDVIYSQNLSKLC